MSGERVSRDDSGDTGDRVDVRLLGVIRWGETGGKTEGRDRAGVRGEGGFTTRKVFAFASALVFTFVDTGVEGGAVGLAFVDTGVVGTALRALRGRGGVEGLSSSSSSSSDTTTVLHSIVSFESTKLLAALTARSYAPSKHRLVQSARRRS